MASKEFGLGKSLMVHDIPLVKGYDENSVVILKEVKRGSFNLIKYDEDLKKNWEKEVDFSGINVPQLKLGQEKILLVSYNFNELTGALLIEVRSYDPSNGQEFSRVSKTILSGLNKFYSPKIEFSADLEKFVVFNYKKDGNELYQYLICSTEQLEVINTVTLTDQFFSAGTRMDTYLSNEGEIFSAYADPKFLRLAGFYLQPDKQQFEVLESNIFFRRPTQTIDNIIVSKSGDNFYASLGGLVENELIGVSITCFNFNQYQVHFHKLIDFTTKYLYNLYQNTELAYPDVKKNTLADPIWLNGYSLMEMFINQENDIILTIEKNEIRPSYHNDFINSNLSGTLNTDRKLQKSEDILVLAIDPAGDIKWDHVLQKYQVFKPYSYSLSYVSNFDGKNLNLFVWTKKGKKNFYVSQINTVDGNFMAKAKEILPGEKFTFNKNYTAWINTNKLFVLAQKNNRSGKRTIYTVSIN